MKIKVLILRNRTYYKINTMVDAIIEECIKNHWELPVKWVTLTVKGILSMELIINGQSVLITPKDFDVRLTITKENENMELIY